MRKYLIISILLFSIIEASPQTINIIVNNLTRTKAQLSYLRGEDVIPVDSITSINNYYFHYSFANNTSHPGIYRLSLSDTNWMDFIVDRQDVILNTDANNIIDSMETTNSENNKIFYYFLKFNKLYKRNIENLLGTLYKYSKDDDHYISAKNSLVKHQEEYLRLYNIASQTKKNSFGLRYLHSSLLPAININSSQEIQIPFLKIHYLDNVDFNDDDLIYTDVFTNKLKEYLTLFKNPQLSKDLLVREYFSAVDTILNKAKVNQLVYEDISEYLINKFKEFGYNEVIAYIMDNYVIKDDLCIDEKLKNSVQSRINQSKRFKLGTKVPDIILPDSSGNKIDLFSIKSEKTLIIYYASWCPHCQKLLPKLNDFYRSLNGAKLKIMAISIDTNRTEWLNFVRKYNFNWINVSDLKGGSGKAAGDYLLYATPTMFLVNDKKEIIAVLSNLDDVKKYIY